MKVGLIALHYPRPEHWDEMISRVHQAAEVMAATPGCLAVDCWVSDDRQAVVTTAQWESEQALLAGFAAARAAGVDFDYDERESRPRQVFRLVSALASGRADHRRDHPAAGPPVRLTSRNRLCDTEGETTRACGTPARPARQPGSQARPDAENQLAGVASSHHVTDARG